MNAEDSIKYIIDNDLSLSEAKELRFREHPTGERKTTDPSLLMNGFWGLILVADRG